MKTLTLETYPVMFLDSDCTVENENYDDEIRVYAVPEDWAIRWILANTSWNVTEVFDEYTWDVTFAMYEDAIREQVLINERTERR